MKLIIDIPEDYVNDFKLQVALIGEDLKDSPSGMAKYVIAEGISLEEELENQKTGHWILADEQNEADVSNDNYRYICSGCGHSDIQSKSVKVPYCWYCGAKMESEE